MAARTIMEHSRAPLRARQPAANNQMQIGGAATRLHQQITGTSQAVDRATAVSAQALREPTAEHGLRSNRKFVYKMKFVAAKEEVQMAATKNTADFGDHGWRDLNHQQAVFQHNIS